MFTRALVSEAYLGHCQTFMIEHFCENSNGVSYYFEEAPLSMFDKVLNTSLCLSHILEYIMFKWTKLRERLQAQKT